jgi:hypothetical protein
LGKFIEYVGIFKNVDFSIKKNVTQQCQMVMSNATVLGGSKCNGPKTLQTYSSICSYLKCGLTNCYGAFGYGALDGKF